MAVNQQLMKAELKAVKAVEDVFAAAEQACDGGVWHALSSESTSKEEPKSLDSVNVMELVEVYYLPASRQIKAYYRSVLYKALYQTWKTSSSSSTSNVTLVEFATHLPSPVRKRAGRKAQEIVDSLAGVKEFHLRARAAVHAILDQGRDLSQQYVARKAAYILDPTLSAAERAHELERLEADTVRYAKRQLGRQLQERRQAANEELVALVAKSSTSPTFSSWATETLKLHPL